jgi:hypothetical protein
MSTTENESETLITRREAMQRVAALLGGVALVGGTSLLTGCRDEKTASTPSDSTAAFQKFSPNEIAYLDEIADTILPATKTPGAKAAQTGAFMALMVTDSYHDRDQRVFRQGMKTIDDASKKANGKSFVEATPEQRLAVLQVFDKEQKADQDARNAQKAAAAASKSPAPVAPATPDQKAADANIQDQRQQNAVGTDANPAPAITADKPAHFFRMMKELALLGYFTSEIGCTQAQRYAETPGRFDPCTPYTKGDPAWAAHA